MARKKRRFDQAPLPTPEADKATAARYRDPFQDKVGTKLEEAGKVLEGQGRNILYGLGALLVLGIIVWTISSWMGRSSAEAQTALGKAIETSQAQVVETAPAGSTDKTFKTQRERSEAAIAEFQAVADKFGGSVAEKAKYFIAVNRLYVDRAAAIQELESLSTDGGEVGSMATFALAQTRAEDAKYDEAAELYQKLSTDSNALIAKETIDLALASVYEKQGKRNEAVQVLFDLVRTASEAKDTDGKPIPLSATAQEAKSKLEELDPAKAKEIPEQAPSFEVNPFGN
jgi:predicted negative regulator of RcsB-dependent stress response